MAEISYTSPRDYIGGALIALAQENNKIVVVDADLAPSVTTDRFCEAFPERFFQLGIAEQSCMGVATGLALEGFVPFFASFAIFTAGTAWTQLRQACYAGANIKVIGSHPGLDDGPDGASHHALEDIAMTRTIPNLVVMTPCDHHELAAALRQAVGHAGPVYIRVPRDNTPVLHAAGCAFPTGSAEVLMDEGDDFAVVFEGAAAAQALEGHRLLKEQGRRGKLVSLRTISPLDNELISHLARQVKVMVTVENHSIRAGAGGAVAEVLAAYPCHAPLRHVGIRHVFTESGSLGDLKRKYRLTGEEVAAQCLEVLK